MYNKLVAELVMGRVGYGPSLYRPSWLWAEFVIGRVMGRDVQLPYKIFHRYVIHLHFCLFEDVTDCRDSRRISFKRFASIGISVSSM